MKLTKEQAEWVKELVRKVRMEASGYLSLNMFDEAIDQHTEDGLMGREKLSRLIKEAMGLTDGLIAVLTQLSVWLEQEDK